MLESGDRAGTRVLAPRNGCSGRRYKVADRIGVSAFDDSEPYLVRLSIQHRDIDDIGSGVVLGCREWKQDDAVAGSDVLELLLDAAYRCATGCRRLEVTKMALSAEISLEQLAASASGWSLRNAASRGSSIKRNQPQPAIIDRLTNVGNIDGSRKQVLLLVVPLESLDLNDQIRIRARERR